MKPAEPAPDAPAAPAVGVTIEDTGEGGAAAPSVPDVTLEASRGSEAYTPTAPGGAPAILDLPVIARERYESLGEHARGGLGRVLRAQDRHLGRKVAIKEMLAPADDPGATARFVREALVTSRLQHPGIVPVYDAGYWPGGEPFYAMKLVSGRSLREAISAATGLDERLALLPHVLATAQAVAYAHAEGVIHRDLKPSNVMLGPFGETVVVDWGLAKDLHAADAATSGERPTDVYALSHFDMTRVGAVVGTPGFMPPEQAAGAAVDERADVFALGAILYSVLAGDAPPATGTPPPVAQVAPGAPRDLVAIVTKAMAPAADARYPDAGAFAADLSRFLSGQLVGAREYGALTRVARFFSRRRLPLAVSAVLVALLVVVTVEAFRRVLAARGRAEARSNELVLSQARTYLDSDPTASLAWLEQYPESGADREGAAAIAADALSRGVARHVLHGPGGGHLQDARVSLDGKKLVATDGFSLLLYDVDSGQAIRRVALPDVMRVGFAPDGVHAVGLGQHGDVWWVDTTTGEARRLGGHQAWVQLLAFDGTGRRLATAGPNGDVLVFDLTGDAPPAKLAGHAGISSGIAFTTDGDLVVSSMDGSVRRWPNAAEPSRQLRDADGTTTPTVVADHRGGVVWIEGSKVVHHDGHSREDMGSMPFGITSLAIGADDTIVTGDTAGQVMIWAGVQHAPIAQLPSRVTALSIGPNGEVAAGDTQGMLLLWRAHAVAKLRGHDALIRRLEFLPDGDLLSLGDEGDVRLWTPPIAHRPLAVGSGDVFQLAWSPKSDAVGASCQDGSIRWFPDRAGAGKLLGRHRLAAYGLALTADGSTLVSGGWDGTIGIWPIDGGSPRSLDQGSQVWDVAAAPDGRSVVAGSDDGAVEQWDLATGRGQVLFRHRRQVLDVAFSPDGRTIASVDTDGRLHLHDVGGGTARDLDAGAAGATSITWSRDQRWLYVAGYDGAIRGFDLQAKQPEALVLTRHARRSRTVTVSPDGRFLASGGADGAVHLVDRASGRVRVLTGHTDEVRHVSFSPDSALLASAGWDGTVRVWDTTSGAVAVLRGHRGKVHRVAFSPDGKWLASASGDVNVGIWEVATLRERMVPVRTLGTWIKDETTATIGADLPLATR